MKSGKTLMELAQEVQRQQDAKKDYLVPSKSMHLEDDANTLVVDTIGELGTTSTFHQQMGDRLHIPRSYYNRMKEEAPELLATNVNHWLQSEQAAEVRMLRTLDGEARAVLSKKYRRLDNFDLMECVLPIINQQAGEVVSCEVTERRFYLKVVTPKIQAEPKKGDVVQAGIIISNSEIGMGTLSVQPLVYRLVCLNGMISPDNALRKTHLGKNHEGDGTFELFSDETIIADDKAFWLKVQDVVKAAVNQAWFNKAVENIMVTSGRQIDKPVVEVVRELTTRYTLAESEHDSILNHLIKGGDLSQWGLVNAVTRASQDVDSYDRATELEELGGKIITLGNQEWHTLSA